MSVPESMAETALDTRIRASGSSFYLAMRILPRLEREAMYAIYDFCREVDDIADDVDCAPGKRLAQLARCRADLDIVYDGAAGGRFVHLAGPIRRFGLRREDFHAVIDGMEMDVDGRVVAPSLETLDLYCDRVASAVGRLSVRVFGLEDGAGNTLAHHLGRALQLTNILRDLDEDAAWGRLYLPREDLEAAGISIAKPSECLSHPDLDHACRALARRGREHFRHADEAMAGHPSAQVRAPRIMRAVYGAVLDKLERRGWSPPRGPVSLGKAALLWVVVRHGLLR